MHGIWNDFIILDAKDLEENGVELTKELIQSLCHRNFWIGSDGVILIGKWDKIEFKYRMYNPDGTQAEMCGNGIRCYMKYLIDNGITDKKSIKVETWAGILNLSIDGDVVTATMWKPKIIENKYQNIDKKNIYGAVFARGKLFKFVPVSMWNPHAVIFLKNTPVKDYDIDTYGSVIESDTEIFPHKTNVEFAQRISSVEINMRVYERWAWETLGCGTWACASVVAGVLSWLLEKDVFVRVNLEWGILEIKWSGNMKDEVIMRWKAETSFEWEYFIQ